MNDVLSALYCAEKVINSLIGRDLCSVTFMNMYWHVKTKDQRRGLSVIGEWYEAALSGAYYFMPPLPHRWMATKEEQIGSMVSNRVLKVRQDGEHRVYTVAEGGTEKRFFSVNARVNQSQLKVAFDALGVQVLPPLEVAEKLGLKSLNVSPVIDVDSMERYEAEYAQATALLID